MEFELINKINKLKYDINETVSKIKYEVKRTNGLTLMVMSHIGFLISSNGIKTGADIGEESFYSLRVVEYIQSVIVSEDPSYIEFTGNIGDDIIEIYSRLYELIRDMYRKIEIFHVLNSEYKSKTNIEYNIGYEYIHIDAINEKSTVRGVRYQIHESDHLRDLLYPYDNVLKTHFNVSLDEFIKGLKKLQKSITNLNEEETENLKNILKIIKDGEGDLTEIFGMCDVMYLTGLPEKLIRELSWGVDEYKKFFSGDEYSGWPIKTLPLESRPFLYINGRFYCFNPYFYDNLYRSMHKIITNLDDKYRSSWANTKNKITEEIPFNLFSELLNNPVMYRNVYYEKPNGNKGEWCETDGIIIYDDHLIIIEIKAGQIRNDLVAENPKPYVGSIKQLTKDPYDQAMRFIEYVKSSDEVKIHTLKENREKSKNTYEYLGKIKRDDFRYVTICCITLESISPISKNTKLLQDLGFDFNGLPLWSISINDLRVFKDIFDSPGIFINYIENRLKLHDFNDMILKSELDHLGMYLKYSEYLEKEKNILNVEPSRYDLDMYYANKTQDNEIENILNLKIGRRIKELIYWLDNSDKTNKNVVTNHIMNLEKSDSDYINNSLEGFVHGNYGYDVSTVIRLFAKYNVIIFCSMEGRNHFEEKHISNVLSNSPKNKLILCIYITYCTCGILKEIQFDFLKNNNIVRIDKSAFDKMDDKIKSTKIKKFKEDNEIKKIKRNDLCPCESGKKYKKCCGK